MQSVGSQDHLISCFKDIAPPHGLRGEEALLVSGLRQDKYGAIFFSSQARASEVSSVWRRVFCPFPLVCPSMPSKNF